MNRQPTLGANHFFPPPNNLLTPQILPTAHWVV